MMRILYLGNKLSKHGNTPTSVETLGGILAQHVHVVSASDKKHVVLRLLHMWWCIVKNRKKTDCLLIDTYSTANFHYAWSGALFAKIFGIPYIPILRGGNLENRLKGKLKILARMFFDNASCLVAPSGFLMDVFQRYGYAPVYIPNSIVLKRYSWKRRSDINPNILYVRAFSNVYNPMMAIEVLELLKKKYPHATLCMVGPDKDGTLEKVKTLTEQKGLNASVTFPGVLTKEAWHKLSENYDIFINTTHIDNTPVSVIEAMALGLPVVSTDVGGIPYLITHNEDGILVGDNDAEGMAEAIDKLLQDPQKVKRITEKARKKVEAFDQDKVVHQWLKLFSEVCGEMA